MAVLPQIAPAVHIEVCLFAHIHATAAASSGVAVDGSAIHIKSGTIIGYIHTAADLVIADIVIRDHVVVRDTAAVHIEGSAAVEHIYASAVFAGSMCDFAERSVGITVLAVRQGEGHAGICGDHITIVIGCDAVTVQAERDTAVGLDHVIRRKVGGQVISSRRKRIVAVAAHSPFDVVNIQCAAYLLDLLGKGGLAAFSCVAAAVAGAAPAEVVGVPVTQLNLSTRQLKTFAANIGNEVIGGLLPLILAFQPEVNALSP